MFAAKDKNGSVWLFEYKPCRGEEEWYESAGSSMVVTDSNKLPYSELSWNSEPIEVIVCEKEIVFYKEGYSREEYIEYLKNHKECSVDNLCEMLAHMHELLVSEKTDYLNILARLRHMILDDGNL